MKTVKSKTHTTALCPQSDSMVERYIKTVEEHPRKVVPSNQRNWVTRLLIFLLAYKASINDTIGLIPASLVFRRELRLPRELLFGKTPNKEQPTINHAANLVDQLCGIHNYACQHLKLASDQMKTHYN
jgi:hypothetical protein